MSEKDSNKVPVTVFVGPGAVREIEKYARITNESWRFDGVALAELLRAGVELVLEARPDDQEFRDSVAKANQTAHKLLDGTEGAEGVLEVIDRPFPN